MLESRTYGSVRGALSNGRPYRVAPYLAAVHESENGTKLPSMHVRVMVAIEGKADIRRAARNRRE
jgi:hypothetical protein